MSNVAKLMMLQIPSDIVINYISQLSPDRKIRVFARKATVLLRVLLSVMWCSVVEVYQAECSACFLGLFGLFFDSQEGGSTCL